MRNAIITNYCLLLSISFILYNLLGKYLEFLNVSLAYSKMADAYENKAVLTLLDIQKEIEEKAH